MRGAGDDAEAQRLVHLDRSLAAAARKAGDRMGDEVSDAFDAFDRRWAERRGVFERRTIRRELELVVMPGQDARALEAARRRGSRVGAAEDTNGARPSA